VSTGQSPFDLTGQVVVVTGGGTGFGAETAVALGRAGAEVVVLGRRSAPLAETVRRIAGEGGRAAQRTADVGNADAVRAVFADLVAEFGSLDVLVNNAAVVHEAGALDVTTPDWRSVVEINLGGTFYCAQAFAQQEPDRDRVIVNVSSIAARSGVAGQAPYSASKGAVEALTRALAIEFVRRRIRVNAVAPGYMLTEMPAELMRDPELEARLLRKIPMYRLADPAEVAPAVVFLASAASSYMTGSILRVDGGYTAR
jgi:NAD(P)-dependent dehydrogenase (short-subunit alcohol dehydrogenase family)